MIYKGTVKGNVIELEKPLPYPEGQYVYISIEQIEKGSPVMIRIAMHEPTTPKDRGCGYNRTEN